VGMFGNGFYKHFPSPSSTCQRRQDWWKALILNSPNSPNLLLDQLGVAPSPPGTIQQHNARIAREGAFPRAGGSDSVKRVPKGEKKWSHPVSYCDIDDV
jgi:hypothetical protein